MKKILSEEIVRTVKIALLEDDAFHDLTSDFTIAKNTEIAIQINAREDLVFCGRAIILEVFAQLKKSAKFRSAKIKLLDLANDGEVIKQGKSIVHGKGDAKLIFAAERVILNLVQHLSGISTFTNVLAKRLNNSKTAILDTRKTLPGLRYLQKYAVTVGGGKNHRMNLSEMILIKDNHIATAGGVKNAMMAIRKELKNSKKIEIECDNYRQVCEALECKPDIIMLDNMTSNEIKKCAQTIRQKSRKIKIEISGGVNESNIAQYAKLDIDFISIGKVTHSVRAVDIGLDVI